MNEINFENVEYRGMAVNLKQCPQDGLPEIVLAGRSNVGKSSLVNAISNRKAIARVSSTPGKTQAVQYFKVDDQFYITDLPGYGYAKTSQANIKKYSSLVDDYLTGDRPIRAVLHLMDVRHKPSEGDRAMQEWLNHRGIPFAVVLTKTDKLSAAARSRQARLIKTELGLPETIDFAMISNSKRSGVGEVRTVITRLLENSCQDD